MRPLRSSIGILLASATLVGVSLPSIALAVSVTSRYVVADHANRLVATGPVSPTTPVSFRVVLQPNHADELNQLLQAQQDVTSPLYHHYLRTGAFAAYFGATRSQIATVKNYFATYGITVSATAQNGYLLRARGTASAVHDALQANLRVRDTSGGARVVLTQSATLPDTLRSLVKGVVGLSTPYLARHHVAPLTTTSHGVMPTTCAGANARAAVGRGLTPATLSSLYGIDTQLQAGNDGSGQTVAVYELAPFRPSDITSFNTCYGVSPTIQTHNVDGGTGFIKADMEPTLDIQEIAVFAPEAKQIVYQGPNNSVGPTDTYAAIANDNLASVVSVSWGMCEAYSDATNESVIFQQMAAQGQTVIASAGDNGASDCWDGTPQGDTSLAVDDPASQPYVTGIGGVWIRGTNPLVQEVWNDGSGAGGGGLSASVPRPSWQVAAGLSTSGVLTRAVPDLSLDADPRTGFITYFGGSWYAVGGTSMGSPLLSALVANATQSCAAGRLGFLNPRLYQLASLGGYFTDVTVGNNDLVNNGAYYAGTGYDPASGLGTPNPATFAAGLCPSIAKASNATVTAPTTTSIDVSGPVISFIARDERNGPMVKAPFTVTATQANGTPLVANSTQTTDASGAGSFQLSTTTPGTVTVTVTIGSAVAANASVNFVSPVTSTNVTALVAGLNAVVPFRTATLTTNYVAAGRRSNNHLVSAWGTNVIHVIDYTVSLKAPAALRAPDVACAVVCTIVYPVNKHVEVVTNATGVKPTLLDLMTKDKSLPLAATDVRVMDNGTASGVTVAYVTPTGALELVQLSSAGVITGKSLVTYGAIGTPALVPGTTPTQVGVVVRKNAGYYAFNGTVGGAWQPANLALAGSKFTSNPIATVSAGSTYVLGRTSTSHVFVGGVGLLPVDLGATAGDGAFVAGSTSANVLTFDPTSTGSVWAQLPNWTALNLSTTAGLTSSLGTLVGTGARAIVLSGSTYVALLR